jgi:paraquat-inducible protein A
MDTIIECKHCGLFLKNNNEKIKCPRCCSKIKNKEHSVDSLYYAITALLLFVLLNIYPLLTLSLNGNTLKTTLIGTISIFFKEDFLFVGALVLFTIILAPVLNSFTIIFVFIQSKMKRKIFSFRILYDGFHFFKTWSFIEVYIIGVIVTYIKLTGMTSATSFDTGFYIMLFYLFIFYMSNKKFDIKSVLE